MPLGKILSDTAIGGEPVLAGEFVEVDDATFRQLRRCGRIELAGDDAPAPKKTEKVTFKKVNPPEKTEVKPAAAK